MYSLIPGRGCFGDLPGDKIVISPPSPIVEPLKSVFKAGANADAGAGKFEVAGGRNDERFGAGGIVRRSEAR